MEELTKRIIHTTIVFILVYFIVNFNSIRKASKSIWGHLWQAILNFRNRMIEGFLGLIAFVLILVIVFWLKKSP